MLRHYLNGVVSAETHIDAAAELAKFKKQYTIEPIIKQDKKKNLRPWFIGFASGIAACLVLIFCLNLSSLFETEKVIVYQSNPEASQEITLQHGQQGIEILNQEEMSYAEAVQEDQKKADKKENVKEKEPEMQVISVPTGKSFHLTLSDGTKVHLNANSRLSFPETFAGAERRVMLQGEAYFEVTKDPEHQFVVQTSCMDTRVFGTEFDVKDFSQGLSSVLLVNGSVEVCKEDGTSSKLVPGQIAETTPDGGITVKAVDDIDVYCSWHKGEFYFDGRTLAETCRDLGQWYNRDVVFNNTKALDLRLHMKCSREQSLESTLDVMNSFGKTHFSLDEDGTIVVE